MKKALHVAWKDIRIRVTDRGAFIFLLLTPFALTIIMGAAFGSLGGGSSGPSAIPVAVVSLDDGELGQALVDVFTSKDLSDLLDVQVKATAAEARSAVDEENFAAAVIIPAGFTETIMPGSFDMSQGMALFSGGGFQLDQTNVTVYTNPTWPISANIVKSIVEAFAWQVSSSTIGGYVSVEQLLTSGKLNPAGVMTYVPCQGKALATHCQKVLHGFAHKT